MVRVVVVGGTGNVGTAVIDALAADPRVEGITALARRVPARTWTGTQFRSVDVTRDDLRPHVEGADVVIHLAWLFQPTHQPTVTWNVNVGGGTRLFAAVADVGVPALIYASSIGAYSPAPGREVDETWATDSIPTAAYGREKAYLERVLDTFEATRTGTRVVRMRMAFVFQRSAASQQRRLFAGPFLPGSLLKRRVPLLPFPAGLRLQAVHASDVAAAFRLAALGNARGAFNLAAEPVIDGQMLASLLGGRCKAVPPRLVKMALAAAWHARVAPAEPELFQLALGLPTMKTDRAREELGWVPRVGALDALAEAIAGMAEGAGSATAPLAPDSAKRRLGKPRTGTGQNP